MKKESKLFLTLIFLTVPLFVGGNVFADDCATECQNVGYSRYLEIPKSDPDWCVTGRGAGWPYYYGSSCFYNCKKIDPGASESNYCYCFNSEACPNASACTATGCGGAYCGDGDVNQIDEIEECDGLDKDGYTCQSLGYDGGSLGCTTNCKFDTSSCTGGTESCSVQCAQVCGSGKNSVCQNGTIDNIVGCFSGTGCKYNAVFNSVIKGDNCYCYDIDSACDCTSQVCDNSGCHGHLCKIINKGCGVENGCATGKMARICGPEDCQSGECLKSNPYGQIFGCYTDSTCSTCPTSPCSSGAKQCSGTTGYQTCGDSNNDGCLEWGPVANCSSGNTCSGSGVCAPSTCPTSPCSSGAKQCSGTTGYQTCGDSNNDGCLEWGPVTNCSSGNTCSGSGVCAPGGTTSCTSGSCCATGNTCSVAWGDTCSGGRCCAGNCAPGGTSGCTAGSCCASGCDEPGQGTCSGGTCCISGCDQSINPVDVNIENPLNADNFEEIISGLIDFLFSIAIILAPLMIVIGGYIYLTSGGDVKKIDQGKKLMIWAAAGLGIILLAKAFVSMVEVILGA